MVKIDTSIWDNMPRMRKRMLSMAKIVLVLAVLNLYPIIQNESWIILGINILYIITTFPIFLSHAKWEKKPPKEQNE